MIDVNISQVVEESRHTLFVGDKVLVDIKLMNYIQIFYVIT